MRVTPEFIKKVLQEIGWTTLSRGTYQRNGCVLGALYEYYGYECDEYIADTLGVDVEYIIDLERGFEGWEYSFEEGYEDGAVIYQYFNRGHTDSNK